MFLPKLLGKNMEIFAIANFSHSIAPTSIITVNQTNISSLTVSYLVSDVKPVCRLQHGDPHSISSFSSTHRTFLDRFLVALVLALQSQRIEEYLIGSTMWIDPHNFSRHGFGIATFNLPRFERLSSFCWNEGPSRIVAR